MRAPRDYRSAVRRRPILAAIAAAIALAAPSGAAQEPADDDQSVELASEVVVVPLAVRGPSGRAVADLTEADFSVADNGAAQEIAFFRRDTAPIDVALLVDTSASTG